MISTALNSIKQTLNFTHMTDGYYPICIADITGCIGHFLYGIIMPNTA